MNKKPVKREKALVVFHIALVGFLCWIVLSSSLTSQPGSVEANGQKIKKAGKLKDRSRFAPVEGVPEALSPQKILAQVGTPVACTGFDFEGGALQGFTTVPTFGTPVTLWHVTNGLCRSFLTGHSTPYTFYYGQDGTCNYSTGARNAADLISPSVSLAGRFPPFSVGFNYLLFVEGGGFDPAFVDISTNNGTTWTQILSKANLINDNQWHNVSTDVTSVVGAATSVRLRFRFDTIDNIANSTTGWHVDDIAVCGQQFNFCMQSDSGDNILQFNSITGAFEFRQCSTNTVITGTGTITTNGCTVTLQQNTGTQFVNATFNTCTHTGSATVTQKVVKGFKTYNINDPDTTNNTCACAP